MIGNEVVVGLGSAETREAEYWLHVASQRELPITNAAIEVDDGESDSEGTAALERLLLDLPSTVDTVETHRLFVQRILAEPELIVALRKLVGVSDKRLYLDLSYMFSRITDGASRTTLCGCKPHELTKHGTGFFLNILRRSRQEPKRALLAATSIVSYLADRGLIDVLSAYSRLTREDRARIVTALILPKESQQNEAKRRGHGAEVALAILLTALGIQYRPPDKVANPMSPDPNIGKRDFDFAPRDPATTYSFDLVVVDLKGLPRVCVQGLIQSSDPGQFGVDKSNQTVEIAVAMEGYNATPAGRSRPVELWGLLDGVGYCENKNGTINKMLENVQQFLQIKTLYKAGLRLHALGLTRINAIEFDTRFYSDLTSRQMQRYVPEGVRVITASQAEPDWRKIQAGAAQLYI